MDDFSAASTASESTGASVPDSSGAAASASSVDTSSAAVSTSATPEAAPAASQSVTTPVPTEPSIDAGWNLDDETESAALVPENDDDVDKLIQEPGVDPEKVPGVVVALREARSAARTTAKENFQLREENTRLKTTLEQVGGETGAQTWMQLLQAPQSEHGANPFLDELHANAYPAFERLLKDAVLGTPELAIQVLQESGHLPEIPTEAPAASNVFTADTLAGIPAHLQEIAKALPAHVQEDLLQQPEEVRNFNLERELKLSRLDASDRARAQEQYQQQYQSAQQQGRQAVVELTNQYEQANLQILSKWQPYGPENAAANQRLYGEVVEGAMAELLRDKQYAQMYQDSQTLLENAPLRRLQRDAMNAARDEQQARHYAARVNTRLGQLIRERVKEREAVYSDARKWREHQQSQTQSRTEIGGPSSQATGVRGVPTLKDGRINPAYLEEVSRQYGSQRAT